MDDQPHYIHLHCRCGHVGLVGLTAWAHRDAILPRARCTACGHRGAQMLTVYTIAYGMGTMEDQLAKVAGVPIYRV